MVELKTGNNIIIFHDKIQQFYMHTHLSIDKLKCTKQTLKKKIDKLKLLI